MLVDLMHSGLTIAEKTYQQSRLVVCGWHTKCYGFIKSNPIFFLQMFKHYFHIIYTGA